jgi:hypothetical protein
MSLSLVYQLGDYVDILATSRTKASGFRKRSAQFKTDVCTLADDGHNQPSVALCAKGSLNQAAVGQAKHLLSLCTHFGLPTH